MVLEQVGMGAGMMKRNGTRRVVNLIDKHPVALDMTAECAPPFAMKRVVLALRRQGLLVDEHSYDFTKFIEVSAAFSHQLAFFSERLCVKRLEHGLLVVEVVVRVIPVKVFPHLLKGVKTAQRGRNLAPHHGHGFPKGGGGLGVKLFFPRHGVAVRGADGAFTRMCRLLVYSRNKNKHSPPRRNFTGYINNEPVVGRYFHGFRNVHLSSIA